MLERSNHGCLDVAETHQHRARGGTLGYATLSHGVAPAAKMPKLARTWRGF
jgi:hypothetical protein